MFGLQLQAYGLMFLAVVAALVGLYGYGKHAGRRASEIRQQNQAMKVIRDAQQASKDVRALDDDDVHSELRSNWQRD